MKFMDFNGNEYDTLEEANKANQELVSANEKTVEEEPVKEEPVPEEVKKATKKELLDQIDNLEKERDEKKAYYKEELSKLNNFYKQKEDEVVKFYKKEREQLNNKIAEIRREAEEELENLKTERANSEKEIRKDYDDINTRYWTAIRDYQNEYGNGTYYKVYDNNKVRKEFLASTIDDIFGTVDKIIKFPSFWDIF